MMLPRDGTSGSPRSLPPCPSATSPQRKSIARGIRARFSVYFGRRSTRTSYPKRDAAVLLQADFSESPDYIIPLLKALEGGADIVAGVVEENGRLAPNGRPAPRAVRLARWMAPWVLGRAYGGAPVSNPLSGFRAYRLIVLKRALAEFRGRPFLTTDGWASNVELLGLVAPYARRIAEAPSHAAIRCPRAPLTFERDPNPSGAASCTTGEMGESPQERESSDAADKAVMVRICVAVGLALMLGVATPEVGVATGP